MLQSFVLLLHLPFLLAVILEKQQDLVMEWTTLLTQLNCYNHCNQRNAFGMYTARRRRKVDSVIQASTLGYNDMRREMV